MAGARTVFAATRTVFFLAGARTNRRDEARGVAVVELVAPGARVCRFVEALAAVEPVVARAVARAGVFAEVERVALRGVVFPAVARKEDRVEVRATEDLVVPVGWALWVVRLVLLATGAFAALAALIRAGLRVDVFAALAAVVLLALLVGAFAALAAVVLVALLVGAFAVLAAVVLLVLLAGAFAVLPAVERLARFTPTRTVPFVAVPLPLVVRVTFEDFIRSSLIACRLAACSTSAASPHPGRPPSNTHSTPVHLAWESSNLPILGAASITFRFAAPRTFR